VARSECFQPRSHQQVHLAQLCSIWSWHGGQGLFKLPDSLHFPPLQTELLILQLVVRRSLGDGILEANVQLSDWRQEARHSDYVSYSTILLQMLVFKAGILGFSPLALAWWKPKVGHIDTKSLSNRMIIHLLVQFAIEVQADIITKILILHVY
jgi:hypothetical protein